MISINSFSFRFKRPAPQVQEFNIFPLLFLVMGFDDARDWLTVSCCATFVAFCPFNDLSFDWCSKRNIFLSVRGEGRYWYWNSFTQNPITPGNIVLSWRQYLKLAQTTVYITSDRACSCNVCIWVTYSYINVFTYFARTSGSFLCDYFGRECFYCCKGFVTNTD